VRAQKSWCELRHAVVWPLSTGLKMRTSIWEEVRLVMGVLATTIARELGRRHHHLAPSGLVGPNSPHTGTPTCGVGFSAGWPNFTARGMT
jgi:hypothetical protein